MKDNVKNWLPLVVFFALLLGGIIVLIVTMKPKKNGEKAAYVDGFSEIAVGDEHYVLVNDIESQSYIGSGVGDFVKCKRSDTAASITGGFMTLNVLYRVEGDASGNFLTDSNGRIYAKKEISQSEKERLSLQDSYVKYKVIDTDKKSGQFHDISIEQYAKLMELASDTEDVIRLDDKQIAEEFDNRREVFAFTADEAFFRACAELFLYNNEVYLTIDYLNAKQSETKKAVLTGTKLPEELQTVFRPFWPKQR